MIPHYSNVRTLKNRVRVITSFNKSCAEHKFVKVIKEHFAPIFRELSLINRLTLAQLTTYLYIARHNRIIRIWLHFADRDIPGFIIPILS